LSSRNARGWIATVGPDDALLLTACIYGLVQAARQYYKKIAKILRKIGFSGGEVDPCLFMRKSDKGVVYIAVSKKKINY
jgi:hypothetical protein